MTHHRTVSHLLSGRATHAQGKPAPEFVSPRKYLIPAACAAAASAAYWRVYETMPLFALNVAITGEDGLEYVRMTHQTWQIRARTATRRLRIRVP